MKTTKKVTSTEKKTEHINTDLNRNDYETFSNLKKEHKFSARELFAYVFDIYRQALNNPNVTLTHAKRHICQYQFGGFCTNTFEPQKKLKEVTDEYCQACLQATKNRALQSEGFEALQTLFDYCHVPEECRAHPFYKWAMILDFYDNNVTNVRLDIEEFKKTPIGELVSKNETLLTELSTVTSEKATIENDNTFLKGELQKANLTISELKTQLEKQRPEIKTYAYQRGTTQ